LFSFRKNTTFTSYWSKRNPLKVPAGALTASKRYAAYQAFEAAVTADYDAESAVERELVLRLASVLWRLRRATGIETALFESVTAEPSKGERDHSRLSLVGGADLPEHNQLYQRP
jgi:hypothetical protein